MHLDWSFIGAIFSTVVIPLIIYLHKQNQQSVHEDIKEIKLQYCSVLRELKSLCERITRVEEQVRNLKEDE